MLFIPTLLRFLILAQCVVGANTEYWKWTKKSEHHKSIVALTIEGRLAAGVYVAPHEIVTARHVVEGFEIKDLRIRTIDGQTSKGKYTLAKPVAAIEEMDCILIRIDDALDVPTAKIAPAPITEGDIVEITGLGGGSLCLRHFSVRAAVATNKDIIWADTLLLPGDSGGGVFNAAGELAGVVSGGWLWCHTREPIFTSTGLKIRPTWPARCPNQGAIISLLRQRKYKQLEPLVVE